MEEERRPRVLKRPAALSMAGDETIVYHEREDEKSAGAMELCNDDDDAPWREEEVGTSYRDPMDGA